MFPEPKFNKVIDKKFLIYIYKIYTYIQFFVYCRRKMNTARFSHRTIKCRNFSKYNPVNLRKDVRDIEWTPIYENNTDVNSALSYLTSKLKDVFDTHAPLIEKQIKGKPCNWMNENIKKEMTKRDQLLRKARKKKTNASRAEYKLQRNKCNNLVKRAKSTHYRDILNEEEKVNPKTFWRTIKSIFPTKSAKHSASGTFSSSDRVLLGLFFIDCPRNEIKKPFVERQRMVLLSKTAIANEVHL